MASVVSFGVSLTSINFIFLPVKVLDCNWEYFSVCTNTRVLDFFEGSMSEFNRVGRYHGIQNCFGLHSIATKFLGGVRVWKHSALFSKALAQFMHL